VRQRRSWLYFPILALVLLVPRNASTCGPFFPDAVFTYETLPGKPLKAYAGGNLGVVLPGFSRSYLVIAYRYFTARPLSTGETRDALDYWRWRLQSSYADDAPRKQPEHEWLEARNAIAPQNLPAITKFQQVEPWDFQQLINCQDDAFHTAALTLKDRAKRFGARSEEIREWVQGQDVVFSNCAGKGQIPGMIPQGRPAVLKADRQYQIAAAEFYQRDFDAAQQQFDQIARDRSSPWHTIAPYLAARCVWREAVLSDGENKQDMVEAYQRLRQILNDPRQRSMHRAARELLGYVIFRLYPEQRARELARLLSGPRPDPDFYQDLIDFTFSMDNAVGDPVPYLLEYDASPDKQKRIDQWFEKQYQRLAAVRAGSELTDWIFTFHQPGKAGTPHAINIWRKQHSQLWLVAALSRIGPADPAASELLSAAEQVPSTSPAYATFAYHRVRLLIARGELDKARGIVDSVLGSDALKLNSSSRNLFLAQREQLATSFQDFLAFAPRPLVNVEYGFGYGSPAEGYMDKKDVDELLYGTKAPVEQRFDGETAMLLNIRIPLELLQQASLSDKIPQRLRGELVAATWTRAVMLGRHDVAEALLPAMEEALPSAAPWLKSYAAAQGTEEKWYAALFLILQFPGLRPYVNAGAARQTKTEKIDDYRDNWWCVDVGANAGVVNFLQNDYGIREATNNKYTEPEGAPAFPKFLTPAQLEAARNEWKELSHSGTGPNYLVREVLRWARLQPDDPRIPEALHLAVRSTRFGCDNNETTSLSRKAFMLLHSRYRNSKWAQETPYWF
jgi:hypothetical protein